MPNPPLAPEVLEALRQFDSPTIANAIESFKVRDDVTGYASLELRCLFPERKPMLGYAVTCTADTSMPGDTRPSGLGRVWEALEAAPGPAVLVIQHSGHDRLRSCMAGDMVCTGLQAYGAAGCVTDAAIRDLSGIRARTTDFQLFAAGFVVAHGHTTFIDVNIPVSICGLPIKPGDLLHGDDSGLVSIPLEVASRLAEAAQAVRNREKEWFDFLASSDFNFEGLKQRLGGHK
jgi:4-hydroxy-4-methyl-2-oxoglutarate aldolase